MSPITPDPSLDQLMTDLAHAYIKADTDLTVENLRALAKAEEAALKNLGEGLYSQDAQIDILKVLLLVTDLYAEGYDHFGYDLAEDAGYYPEQESWSELASSTLTFIIESDAASTEQKQAVMEIMLHKTMPAEVIAGKSTYAEMTLQSIVDNNSSSDRQKSNALDLLLEKVIPAFLQDDEIKNAYIALQYVYFNRREADLGLRALRMIVNDIVPACISAGNPYEAVECLKFVAIHSTQETGSYEKAIAKIAELNPNAAKELINPQSVKTAVNKFLEQTNQATR